MSTVDKAENGHKHCKLNSYTFEVVPQISSARRIRVECLLPLQNEKIHILGKDSVTINKREILEKFHQNSIHHQQTGSNYPLRLTERHFPLFYADRNRNRRCIVCSKNDKKCEFRYECNVGLCIDPCCRIYHTQLNY